MPEVRMCCNVHLDMNTPADAHAWHANSTTGPYVTLSVGPVGYPAVVFFISDVATAENLLQAALRARVLMECIENEAAKATVRQEEHEHEHEHEQ